MTLWIAVLPVMVIPFLLGGVADTDVVSALCIQLTSIVLALSAGLLASVCLKSEMGHRPGVLVAAYFSVCGVKRPFGCWEWRDCRSSRGSGRFGRLPASPIPTAARSSGWVFPTGNHLGEIS